METSGFRIRWPIYFTVNIECRRLFSSPYHRQSTKSSRLLSLCPSLYFLPHDSKRKPGVSSQVPVLFRELQPASETPSSCIQRVGPLTCEQEPLPECALLAENHQGHPHLSSHSAVLSPSELSAGALQRIQWAAGAGFYVQGPAPSLPLPVLLASISTSLYVSPPSSTLSNRLISIAMPSENNGSSQG